MVGQDWYVYTTTARAVNQEELSYALRVLEIIIVLPYTIYVPLRGSRRGRPPYVAQLDLVHDPALEFYTSFYTVCESFRYRDIMALSRALGISASAIEKWKYGQRMPRIGTALTVLDWVSQGKPMTTQPNKTETTMF